MGLKIAPRNKNQEVEKQLDDMHKNLEIVVKYLDALANRVTDLEANQFEGVVLIQK
jgi:hypothetical protein